MTKYELTNIHLNDQPRETVVVVFESPWCFGLIDHCLRGFIFKRLVRWYGAQLQPVPYIFEMLRLTLLVLLANISSIHAFVHRRSFFIFASTPP